MTISARTLIGDTVQESNHIDGTNSWLVFEERGKPEYPEKDLSEQSREPRNSIHLSLGIEPRPHWWEGSALTTVVSPLPWNEKHRVSHEPTTKHSFRLVNEFCDCIACDFELCNHGNKPSKNAHDILPPRGYHVYDWFLASLRLPLP